MLKRKYRPLRKGMCKKILYLNNRRQLIGEESYIGEMEKAPVYIKEITRKALIKNATFIIMSHNHPGGFVAWLPMRRCDVRDLRGKFENRHTDISKFVNQVAF
ncbi:JAB domain-containing protein [Wolbachia endosymbiont of Anurida maritima]|uniref:JAB domain-containing protein n=1 Tax=Wolbachia endosymbiont of Anurida maritima TaxID=2850562 RepID=UPI0035D08EF5